MGSVSTIFDGEIVCVDRGGHWQFDCSFPQSVILVVPAASCLGNARPNQATGIPRRGSDALRRGFRARAQRRARSSAEIRAVRLWGCVGANAVGSAIADAVRVRMLRCRGSRISFSSRWRFRSAASFSAHTRRTTSGSARATPIRCASSGRSRCAGEIVVTAAARGRLLSCRTEPSTRSSPRSPASSRCSPRLLIAMTPEPKRQHVHDAALTRCGAVASRRASGSQLKLLS